jgi:hypothetical protein
LVLFLALLLALQPTGADASFFPQIFLFGNLQSNQILDVEEQGF